MNCKILAKTQSQSYHNVDKLILPTYNGKACVLPDHAEAFFLLEKGTLSLVVDQKDINLQVEKGVCHVREGESVIFIF